MSPEDLLRERIGHGVDSFLAGRLEEFLLQRLDPGETLAARLARLAREDLDSEPWRELLGLVLVPKTEWFRHADQLLALQAALRDRPRPRIWSAASATGEEVWTAALLFPDAERLLGTDLSAAYLAHARGGRYRRPRACDPRFAPLLGHWRTPEGLQVPEAIRRGPRFERLNLAGDDPYPDTAGGWDLILCRNVLIYFDPELRRRTLRRLAQRLAPGGLIALSPAERAPADAGLEIVPLANHQFAYTAKAPEAARPTATWTPVSTPPTWTPQPPEPTNAGPLSTPNPDSVAPAAPNPTPVAPSAPNPDPTPPSPARDLLRRAAACETTAPEESRDLLHQAAELADLDADLHWAIGRAFRRLGALPQAEAALRRALLLSPHLWGAAFQLGGVLHDAGRPREAAKTYARAARLIELHPGDTEPFYRREALASCRRRIAACGGAP